MYLRSLCLIAVLGLLSCTSLKKTIKPDEFLTQQVAMDRAQRISQVDYQIQVLIDPSQSHFSGENSVQFNLTDTLRDVPIDFREGEVLWMSLNDQPIQRPILRGSHIILPKEFLRIGKNQIKIKYRQAFQTSGVGLHRFQDPEDKEFYLYTQFQPYDASRFAPLFDQPDLKAPMRLTVTAPAHWQVISGAAPERKSLNDGFRTWTFGITARISPYLYSLHAGPYHVWTDKYKNIPLRLFARKSLAKYVNHKEWFLITKQGFEFFERYFDYPYPFEKYDQVLTPEFNFGAMENVAAVTFSEKFITRGRATRQEMQSAANVILHEMAHMWFGNLTTMRWWNGLWLNETFATYMASLALASNTNYRDEAWQEFFGEKSWAMFEDQMSTTHPIDSNIENTDQAFNNFDGITYGKGAAVMKQLAFHIGPSNFKKGAQAYFKRHAYKNTELSDFLAAMEEASNQSLAQWSEAWLKTTGVDRVAWSVQCEQDRWVSLTLSNLDHSTHRREHSLLLQPLGQPSLTVKLSAEKVTLPMSRRACPSFIALNADDHAYLKLSLSPDQTDWLINNFHKLSDPLTRIQHWHALWEDVRDQRLPIQKYYLAVQKHWPTESASRVFDQILQTTGPMFYYWPQSTEQDKAERQSALLDFERLLLNSLKRRDLDLDTRTRIWDGLVAIAETNTLRDQLLESLARSKFPIPLDPDRRWDVVIRVCALNAPSCEAIVEAELQKDTSERARRASIQALSSQPDITKKRIYFNRIFADNQNESFDQVKAMAQGLFPTSQQSLKTHFEKELYQMFKNTVIQRPEHFQEAISSYLNPTQCEPASHQRLKSFLGQNELGDISDRALNMALEEDGRCLAVRRFSGLYRHQSGKNVP